MPSSKTIWEFTLPVRLSVTRGPYTAKVVVVPSMPVSSDSW